MSDTILLIYCWHWRYILNITYVEAFYKTKYIVCLISVALCFIKKKLICWNIPGYRVRSDQYWSNAMCIPQDGKCSFFLCFCILFCVVFALFPQVDYLSSKQLVSWGKLLACRNDISVCPVRCLARNYHELIPSSKYAEQSSSSDVLGFTEGMQCCESSLVFQLSSVVYLFFV